MSTVPGRPTVLVLDATQNLQGWEFELAERGVKALRRRQVQVWGERPWRPANAEEMERSLPPPQDFNCLFLLAHGPGDATPASATARAYWDRLVAQQALAAKLIAVAPIQPYDAALSKEVLRPGGPGAIALAPTTELSARDVVIFFVKFFYELDLHARDSITGTMAQFAYFKAQRLVRNKVGLRC
ncbi:MAG: hypothetical protein HY330_02345 [Chloroflexi bacterium]|nr:hypothetical protein [Chloroflexota bacterium]